MHACQSKSGIVHGGQWAVTSNAYGEWQAVFDVGLYAAIKDAHVLDGYAAAVLRRDLHPWLTETPDVRHSFVLPATAQQ